MKITIELEKVDALAVLGAVEDGALSWRIQAAISTGIEKEYAEARAKSLAAKARLIIDTLYPETAGSEPAMGGAA